MSVLVVFFSIERIDEIGELADVAVDFRVEDLVEFIILARKGV